MFDDRFAWNYRTMTKLFIEEFDSDNGDRKKDAHLESQRPLSVARACRPSQ